MLPIESPDEGEQLLKKESLSKMSGKSEKTPFAKKRITLWRNKIFEKFQRFRNLADRPRLLTTKSAQSRRNGVANRLQSRKKAQNRPNRNRR